MESFDVVLPAETGRLRLLFLNWRDTKNPEGGGSEVYVERIAHSFADAGNDVTIFCAAHDHAPETETVNGVRFIRGGSKLGVYTEAARRLRRGDLGDPDVIIDVHNGIPFFSRVVRPGTPTIVLVHHVHREQWPVVYGPMRSRIGWAIESQLSPRLLRGCQYVAVSQATRTELIALGVRADDIAVIHNGTVAPPASTVTRSVTPRVIVLGRLVPHKRVELAIDSVLEVANSTDVTLDVVGDGWWRGHLDSYLAHHDPQSRVTMHGFVTDTSKQSLLGSAWVMLLPSLKEGWGLAVMEAASYGVPTIAFRAAGGVEESIVDGVTGILVDSPAEMTQALRHLLNNHDVRATMGAAALARSQSFTWEAAGNQFAEVVRRVVTHRSGR